MMLSSALLILAGCAASQHPSDGAEQRLALGDPDASPSLGVLPELSSAATAATPRTHQGMLVAREAFDARLPEPPTDRTSVSLQHWIDTAVVRWLETRRAQTEATRERFLLEGEPNPSEGIVSHAVLGLLHEDTALSLAQIPVPVELDTEPEVADIYRDMAQHQADVFLNSAVVEFRDCANEAYREGGEMRAWAKFCHARFDRLYARIKPPADRVAHQ